MKTIYRILDSQAGELHETTNWKTVTQIVRQLMLQNRRFDLTYVVVDNKTFKKIYGSGLREALDKAR